MDYINDIIKEAMKALENDEDISFLRDIGTGIFPGINRGFSEILENISSSIDMLYVNERKPIYTVPVNKEELAAYEKMIFPMDNIGKESASQKEGGKIPFRRIYLDADYDTLNDFQKSELKAEVIIDGKIHKLDIYCEKYDGYCQKEEELLKVLELNSLEWEVLYTPYSRRFFDIYLKNAPEKILENPDEIRIDYGKYRAYVYENYFLAWNLEEKNVLADKVRSDTKEQTYGYKIFSAEAVTDLIKIPDSKIKGIDRDKNDIFVYIGSLNDKDWELWRITEIEPEKFGNLTFHLLGNKKTEDFISRFKNNSGMRVRSESEIYEIIKSYENIKSLVLKEVCLNAYTEKVSDSYDMNEIYNKKMKIRRKNRDKLNLYFEVIKETKYLKDELSFILSCVAYKYPEYEVRGITEWR